MLCNRLAIDLLGELSVRAVSWVIGFGSMATGLTTAPGSGGDGTGLEVAEFDNLSEQSGSVVHQA